MGEAPREKLNQNKMPLPKPTWERTLPGNATNSNRKPMTIEESINIGYRKRLEMTGLENAMHSEDSFH